MQDETKIDGQTGDVTIELKKKRDLEERVVRAKEEIDGASRSSQSLRRKKDKFEDTWRQEVLKYCDVLL